MQCITHPNQRLVRMFTTSDIVICPQCFDERASPDAIGEKKQAIPCPPRPSFYAVPDATGKRVKLAPHLSRPSPYRVTAGYDPEVRHYYVSFGKGMMLIDVNRVITEGYQKAGNMGFLTKERDIFTEEKLRGE